MLFGYLRMSKNVIYAIVIVVCFIVAGVVGYKFIFSGGSGGISSIDADEMVWVKCNNPDCKAEYQMSKRKYYAEVEERFTSIGQTRIAIPCEKCGQESCYEAVKCSNPECGVVFFKNIVPNDLEDRCPECKQSKTEETRKARLAERR